MKNKETVKIDAKVERIRFPKLDAIGAADFSPQCFYILSCDVGVCKGRLDHLPKTGETLTLDGCWEVSKFNGQPEFVFFHAAVQVPTDERSLLRYACEMTPGFGPAMEERIWAERGDNWRGISLADDIRGLTPEKLAALQKTIDFLNLNQERAKTVSWLVNIGLTLKMAESAFEKWGASTVSRVEADPYILASLPNYGFSDADSHIRRHFKIERNDQRRIDAAIKYYLNQLSAEDTAVSWDDLSAKIYAAIDADPQLVSDATRAMFQSGRLVSFPRTMRIASLRDFTNEAMIYRFAISERGALAPVRARQPKPRDFDLDPDQMSAVQFALDRRFSIINGGAGCGKCLGRGTPVLMYDGTVKNVEDIVVGDILMGPESRPRHVTSTTSGREEMFRVTPKKGEPFTCNRSHILSVLHTRKCLREYTSDKNEPFNISVNDILAMPKARREHLLCWRTGVDFNSSHTVWQPYFVGIWLGDGSCGTAEITKPDPVVYEYLVRFATQYGYKVVIQKSEGRCARFRLTHGMAHDRTIKNVIKENLRRIGIINDKHIPHAYKTASRKQRLSLLAGLIDSDGYNHRGCCEIVQKHKRLSHDIAFLARSLGFCATVSETIKTCTNTGAKGLYYRISITGDLSVVPTIVPRKRFESRRQTKNVLYSGIKIESIGVGDYYGFTLAEPDGLFLLGDFTVTHNTTLIHAMCDSLKGHGEVRLCAFAGKAAARLREATMHDASTIHRMLGWMGDANRFALKTLAGSTVILDEASMVSSDLLAEIVKRNPDRLVLVGDEAQLPPVGSGQPFHDLVKLVPECVHTLAVCYRSREAVLSSALAIRAGQMPSAYAKSESELYDFRSLSDARRAHSAILDAVRHGDIDFGSDILLCCRNGETPDEPCSVRALNADIKSIVNPGAGRIDPGDRIICTVNSSDLDVWNGTTGRCRGFDTAHAMWVDLDFPNSDGETSVLIPKDKVKDWQLAYALTVHKSQGSQYRKVYFLVARRDIATLLSRPMVYTAVTRAKNECYVIGDAWAFSRAIAEVRPKHTAMQEIALEKENAL